MIRVLGESNSFSSSAIDAFLNVDIEDYDKFYRALDTVWKEFVGEYAPLKRSWDSVSDDDKRGELYNKYRPVVDKCKETLKTLSITGYGGLKDVYKGNIEELCKKFDYNFPFGWKQHGDWILKYGKLESKKIAESNSLSDFRGNSRCGHATRVRIKATGKTGWVESTVDDKWGQGIRVVYDDRPGMWPDFFTVDEVEILEPTKKPKTESFDDDFEQYTYVKSKDVNDADGYLTEYTMYYDEIEDRYVFVFGDSDIYNPNDGYEEFDYECDTEIEADEWFDNYEGFEDLDEHINESTKLKEGLTSDDTKHNWFLCSDRYETVEVLPEDKCNSLVIEAVYDDYVREGIIDEDDETYWNENKFYKDFKSDIIEAKYGITKSKTGLKTPSDDYIIIRDSNYVGELPYGYYVDEDGDLLNRRKKVVSHVQNEPDVEYTNTQEEENNLKIYRVWYLPDDPRERETFKDIPAHSKEDARRQVSAYGYVGYVTNVEECN